MNVTHFTNYFIIELEKNSQLDELKTFLLKHNNTCPHIIIDIINLSIDNDKIVKTLLPFHLNWEKRNKSFILVSLIEKDLLKNLISLSSREEAVDFFLYGRINKKYLINYIKNRNYDKTTIFFHIYFNVIYWVFSM